MERLLEILKGRRYTYSCEVELQDEIARILSSSSIPHHRESPESRESRPDFMVGSTAVEVKVDGALSSVIRQLHRYASLDTVAGIILVTGKSRHRGVPRLMLGKPVRVVYLNPLL